MKMVLCEALKGTHHTIQVEEGALVGARIVSIYSTLGSYLTTF